MNWFTRMMVAALMVPFVQCQVEVGDPDSDFATDSEQVGAETLPLVASWYLTGTATPRAVSGFSGSDVHTLGNPSSTQRGVYALLSRERSDDPCYMAVGTEHLDFASSDSVPIVDHCGSKGPNSSTLHAGYLDVSAGGSDDHTFIRAVSVCMNKNNDKVKGIAIAGLKLRSDGTTSLVDVISDPRTNCHHWMDWSTCPAGQIATAIDVHFAPGNEPKEVVGLAVVCRAVAN